MKHLILLAGLAGACASVSAADVDTRSVEAPLPAITTPAEADEALAVIRQAARRACSVNVRSDTGQRTEVSRCVKQAVSDALKALDNLLLNDAAGA